MQNKQKLKIFNISIIVLLTIFICQVFFAITKIINQTNDNTDFLVSAETETLISSKNGYLDLIKNPIDVSNASPVSINNKEDFINAFEKYFNDLKENGGYALESKMNIVGTANVPALGKMSAYQAGSSKYEVSKNGDVFEESITAEVPSPSGSTTGQGENSASRVWYTSEGTTSQKTYNVSYTKNENGYSLIANFDGVNKNTNNNVREFRPLPFILNSNTIANFSIQENLLSYKITLTLNADGYLDIAKQMKEQSNAKDMPKYKNFEIQIIMDKWGNVASITRNETFEMTVKRMGLNISCENTAVSTYVINKKQK